MMSSAIEAAGKIVVTENKRYRVLPAAQGFVPLCRMDISKLDILYLSIPEFERMARNQEFAFENEASVVFDRERMSDSARKEFDRRCEMIRRIAEYYGPTYAELSGKKHKELLKQLSEEYGYGMKALWKWVRLYLQGGCSEAALLDKRLAVSPGNNREDPYQYTVKTGRPAKGGIATGIIVDDEVRAQFMEFLEEYKSGREKTYKNAYAGLIIKYYSTILPDGGQRRILPISQRPTFEQFYRFCKKHMTREEIDAIKTSRAEQRNNKRLLIASSREDAICPGWIVEVDAWEADCSIVSSVDPEQCIGRPIVYFMVDLYSKAIVAMSVSLENNSVQGITNLMINLGEDKQKYAARYGITAFDPALWPSNFIPHEIRCDRGAEVRSDKFGKICNNLGIIRSLQPPAMGSMKGHVEQCFHQLNASIRMELENKGLITKRYDSDHHREAMLTLEDFTRMVIVFVLTQNQKYMMDFLPSREMLETEGFKPIPAALWAYGCEMHGTERMITEATRDMYFYDLLPERMGSISRHGISYKGLKYFNADDAELTRDMYRAQYNRMKFSVRIDPQDVEHIYYMRGNKLYIASLNMAFPEQSSYAGLTWQQFDEYKKVIKQMKKDGENHNLQIEVDRRMINKGIVAGAAKEHFADVTDMRSARKDERYLTNNQNRMITYLREEGEDSPAGNAIPENGQVSIEKSEFESYPDLLAANKAFLAKGRR